MRSTIPLLQHVVEAGLTSTFAIAVATGISEAEALRVLAGEIEPTDDQRVLLERLLEQYAEAIRIVNAETMKQRIGTRC
jgi:hypothetical protein